MKIGDRLKLTRLKKEMTQEEVAEGIISVSYLLKIENNQVTPSEEVLHLLYQRLEIDNLFNERMNELMKQMMLWYKAITDKNEWKEVEMYENIKKMIEYFNDAEANTYFLLMEMRYYLFMKNISAAEAYRKALAIVEESLQLLRQHSDYTSSEYYFHFTVYQYLLSNNVSERDFEMFMKNEVLPYFQKHKKYEDVAQYAEYLADYYERCRKYKLASKYYKMSYEFLKKLFIYRREYVEKSDC